jgi:hypothetical protein
MTWRSVHIYYHGDQDPLILAVIWPLFERLGDDMDRGFFQRHWRQGPHVRVNVDASPESYRQVIRPVIGDMAGRFLAVHPSPVASAEQHLISVHRQLAMAEKERGPLSPWRPDNSVIDDDYDDRRHVVGTREASDLLADFYVATNELAFAMTDQAVRAGDRLSACMDLMIATAHVFAPQAIPQGAMSMRSHAERFLVLTGSADSLRSRWDAMYREQAPDIRNRVDSVVSAVDAGRPGSHVRWWLDVIRPIHRRAGTLWDSGLLPLPASRPDPGVPFDSPFHTALDRNSDWQTHVRDSQWFQQYRLLLNYLYLHFTRLGVLPVQRFWLCHLVACAVEENVGMSAMERLTTAGASWYRRG